MLAPDRTGRGPSQASGWRLQTLDTTGLLHAPAAPLRPLSEARSRDMAKDWAANYVHSVDWRWLTTMGEPGPGESWLTPMVGLVDGEDLTPIQRLFTVADCANGLGSKIDIRKYTFLNTDLAVHLHRGSRWGVDRHPGRKPTTAQTVSGSPSVRCSTRPAPSGHPASVLVRPASAAYAETHERANLCE